MRGIFVCHEVYSKEYWLLNIELYSSFYSGRPNINPRGIYRLIHKIYMTRSTSNMSTILICKCLGAWNLRFCVLLNVRTEYRTEMNTLIAIYFVGSYSTIAY